jgi:L-histidine N-alpha-methyltransferase
MRLRAVRDQRVELPGAEIAVDFRAGDEIRTEISAKFTHERIMRELAEADLRVELLVTDPDGLFALSLAAPV